MKNTPSLMQKSTPWGGSLNLIPMNYRISQKPLGDAAIYGPLAHVSEKTRKKIMAVGFGEKNLHLEHIKNSLGQISKTKKKAPHIQLGFDFGE
jgi:hypothetical protein